MVAKYPPERVAEICGVAARDVERGGGDLRHLSERWCRRCCRASTSRTRPRRPSVQVNNLHLLRGMLGRPGRRHPADERPADGAEQPGDRRRRRPAGLPQLGERGSTSRSWPTSGTSTRSSIPHWAAADARDADLPVRRAGLDRLPVDRGHQPRGVAARARPDPRDPRPGLAVRRRQRRAT